MQFYIKSKSRTLKNHPLAVMFLCVLLRKEYLKIFISFGRLTTFLYTHIWTYAKTISHTKHLDRVQLCICTNVSACFLVHCFYHVDYWLTNHINTICQSLLAGHRMLALSAFGEHLLPEYMSSPPQSSFPHLYYVHHPTSLWWPHFI